MLSKIRNISLPISIKLTIIHSTILLGILLVTGLLALSGLNYFMYQQIKTDMQDTAHNVTNYLQQGTDNFDLLQYNSSVRIRLTYNDSIMLADTTEKIPSNKYLTEQLEDNKITTVIMSAITSPLQIIKVKSHHYAWLNQSTYQNGKSYRLDVFLPVDSHIAFVQTAFNSLLVAGLLGFIISILSGFIIGHKTLEPLRAIITVVNDIKINNIGDRVPLPRSKDELYQLADTFNRMLERIQTGLEQQKRFAADASHELRTPITVIGGYADMLDRWGKNDPVTLNEGISAIKSETQNMHNLIEKLLYLARMDSGAIHLQRDEFDTKPLLEELAKETKLIAPEHTIILGDNPAALILADAQSIKQMLRIFLENALKYTPCKGTITISAVKELNWLRIHIKDTGIGIAPQDQNKIFDRFYRVDKSRSKDTGGAGLGLAIAQWITRMHSGRIELESELNVGTTIIVSLPLLK